jgi:hypothetical protein
MASLLGAVSTSTCPVAALDLICNTHGNQDEPLLLQLPPLLLLFAPTAAPAAATAAADDDDDC